MKKRRIMKKVLWSIGIALGLLAIGSCMGLTVRFDSPDIQQLVMTVAGLGLGVIGGLALYIAWA